MHRGLVYLILLVFLALLLTGCGGSNSQAAPVIDLKEVFPPELPLVEDKGWRFDVDHDGKNEWLVLYHVDMMVLDSDGSPTIAAVYRPVGDHDRRMPPSIVPSLVWVPGQGYICLGDCRPSMLDAISVSAGNELVFIDRHCVESSCDQPVGAALFRWQTGLDLTGGSPLPASCTASGDFLATAACGGFVPLGHFRGDWVAVELDKVTITRLHNDRSDLASREVYQPAGGRYYRQFVQDIEDYPATLLSPVEAEIIFASSPPEEPTLVKIPEKLVLSFYHNYNNREAVQAYFTPEAWESIGSNCADGACGCLSRREDVSRVMVKQLAYESDFKPTVFVIAQVVCVANNGAREPLRTVTWKLERQTNSTWRLFDVSPTGDEYLCPPTGCPPLGIGE